MRCDYIGRLKDRNQNKIILTVGDDAVTVLRYKSQSAAHKDADTIYFSQYPEGSEQLRLAIFGPYNGKHTSIKIQLPRHRILFKTVTLPKATEENLNEVVTFEINRFSPCESHQVYFDYTIINRDNRSISLLLVVVLREVVDELIKRVTSWGLATDDVIVPDIARDDILLAGCFVPALFIDKIKSEHVKEQKSLLAKFFLYTNICLFIACLVYPVIIQQTTISSLKENVTRTTAGVRIVKSMQNKLKTIFDNSNLIVTAKQSHPMFLEIINEFSRILPYEKKSEHDSQQIVNYLRKLEMHTMELRVKGLSSSASDLIAIIEASPFFKNARFSSPVTRDITTGLEFFNLSIDISNNERSGD